MYLHTYKQITLGVIFIIKINFNQQHSSYSKSLRFTSEKGTSVIEGYGGNEFYLSSYYSEFYSPSAVHLPRCKRRIF